jgi:hypothetical protein
MPRGDDRPKPLIYHDMCAVLDVVRLAEGGLLVPGKHCGRTKLLGARGELWIVSTEVRTLIGASEGSMHVETPSEETIPLVRVETPIGPRWRLICKPCGRPVRRLFLPETPPDVPAPWACRHCWGIAYRTPRRARAKSVRERLMETRRLEADLARLKGVMGMTLAELAEEGRRAARGPRRSDT